MMSLLYPGSMSLHSYSRVWLHLIWGTLERRPLLAKPAADKVSGYLTQYSSDKGIYMKINYVNADHVHVLVDLPTHLPIENMMQLFKGSSSHWINENHLLAGKFAWGRGYGAFSVSHSGVAEVANYIATQEEHHRKRSFSEELKLLVERYGLTWHGDETVKTVSSPAPAKPPR
jgi:putative transposase